LSDRPRKPDSLLTGSGPASGAARSSLLTASHWMELWVPEAAAPRAPQGRKESRGLGRKKMQFVEFHGGG